MNRETALKKLCESLKAIYVFAYARTDSAEDAEDLAGDIIAEVIERAASIRNDNSFYGFMWAVAKNLSSKYLRNKSKSHYHMLDDRVIPVIENNPEHEIIANEELMLLRRELSLLAKRHRTVTVKYYIEGKSCIDIAAETGFSHSLVRNILYETRKILKEGVTMERTYGEKSYSPQEFNLIGYFAYSDYDWNKPFRERKLPGNILLSAYKKPMTISELSTELGVSTPYLEDEISMLVKHELLAENKGKYITSVPIFGDDYFERLEKAALPIVNKAANEIYSLIENISLPVETENPKWLAFFLAMRFGILEQTAKGWKYIGGAPILPNGSQGTLAGLSSKPREYMIACVNAFNYNAELTAYITNYCYDNKDVRRINTFSDAKLKALHDIMLGNEVNLESKSVLALIETGFVGVKDGKPSVLFPVLSENELNEIEKVLKPASDCAAAMFNDLAVCAEQLANDYVSKNMRDNAGKAAYTQFMLCGLGMVYEQLKDKFVLPPNSSIVGVVK